MWKAEIGKQKLIFRGTPLQKRTRGRKVLIVPLGVEKGVKKQNNELRFLSRWLGLEDRSRCIAGTARKYGNEEISI